MKLELKIAELLCTRLCHDLTGPIGALANGAEFLNDEGFDLQGQAVELINSSAAQAVARLQFYRKTYGRINEEGEADLCEQKKVANDFFTGSKVTLDWADRYTDASGVSISYKMGRLILNIILIASATLLRGGTVSVKIETAGDQKEITIGASGASIKWDKDIENALQGKITLEDLTPKTVQAELTRMHARELGATLQWKVSDNAAEFVLHQPIATSQEVADNTPAPGAESAW